MNMADRVVNVLHDMNGHDKIQKLLPEIGFHMQFHTRILQRLKEFLTRRKVLVHQQSLRGIADSRILRF
jgi:hypothetical protein